MTAGRDSIADATTETYRGTDQIRRRLAGNGKAPAFKTGEALEEIVARKANEHAATVGSPTRVGVTHQEGRPTDPADVIVRTPNGPQQPGQVKTSNNPVWMAEALSNAKYDDMAKIVPEDKVDLVRNEAARRAERAAARGDDEAARRYRDTAERVASGVDIDGSTVGATSRREARTAATRPRLYAASVDAMAVGREAHRRAADAARDVAAANLFDAATDGVIAFLAGDLTAGQAARGAVRTAVEDAAETAARAGLAGAVRAVAERAGSVPLSDLALAAELTNLTIDTALLAHRYARGELDRADLEAQLGHIAIAAASRWFFAAGAAVVLGPGAPAAIGCLIGHRVAVAAVNALADAQRELDQALLDQQRAETLAREAEAALGAAERRLQDAAHTLHATTALQLDDAFNAIHNGLHEGDHDTVIAGLTALAALCRYELVYADFEQFDIFMLTTDSPIVL